MQVPILRDKYVHEYGFVKLGMEVLPKVQKTYNDAVDLFMKLRANELTLKLAKGDVERFRLRFTEDEEDDPLVVENLAEQLSMHHQRVLDLGKLLEGNKLVHVVKINFYNNWDFKYNAQRIVLNLRAVHKVITPNTTDDIRQIVTDIMHKQKVLL